MVDTSPKKLDWKYLRAGLLMLPDTAYQTAYKSRGAHNRPLARRLWRTLTAAQAFTLVELLVVIGIIALLISMLLPALNQARFAAKLTACASNQRQIYMAVVMYANDNKGSLPGTNAWQRSRGAEVLQSYGAYPWEFDSASDYWFQSPILPPDVTWASTVRWYGIGQLVHLNYLPPASVITCTDFEMTDSINYASAGHVSFTDAYYKYNGDPDQMWANTSGNQTSYVLNTLPYYMEGVKEPAHGKLGRPGASGGRFTTDPMFIVPHQRALIMCLTSYGDGTDGVNPISSAHGRKGVNVTYIDGHVLWQPIDQKTADLINANGLNSSANDLGGYWNSFWSWATKVE